MEREPSHGWAQSGDVKLHYWDWPGDEPALICIHGLTANGRCWDGLAERMGSRHRIIAVDVRGRGLSDKPPAGNYGLKRHVEDMACLARSLDIGPVVAVGHSMGGRIATTLAADHPDLVSRLVAVDGGYTDEETTEESLRMQLSGSLKRLNMVFPSLEAYFDYWRQLPFMEVWTESIERYLAADAEQREDGSVVTRTSAIAVEEDMLSRFKEPAESLNEAATRANVPALVLWAPVGVVDASRPLMSRAGTEKFAGLLPDARLLTIDGANHYSIVLAPDHVNQMATALAYFLGSGL